MKKLIFVLVIPVMMLASGCNQNKEEIARLKATNDSLVMVGETKDATVADFVSSFNDIQANLDSIKMKEKIISKATEGGSELKSRTKDQINSDINMIYKMQQDNRRMIASLRSKLKNAGGQAVEMEKMIDNLSKQVEEKDVQIAQLKEDLTKLNVQVADLNTKVVNLNTNVDSLSTANKAKQQAIDEKTTALNTAYYVIGTTKELTDKKIVTKEGGFIGLGRTKDLAPQVDKKSFTKVDITNLKAIPIMKKKVEILTSHPKDSYRLTGKNESDSLVITNQKEFWSLSKVLVLNVK